MSLKDLCERLRHLCGADSEDTEPWRPANTGDELTVEMPDGQKQKVSMPSVDDDAIQGVDTTRG
ncbi:hypothetical protein ACFY41_29965 [Streptomyces syringium]|uniref:hypothetical protein n=1 Tax=Streptomyces syringium TaxID=76729 RepID=UPI0036D0AED4